MSRPVKHRWVEFFPEYTYYAPRGIRKCDLDEVELKLEELEAMRLKDIEKLTQEECAERMGISRQTFQNVIDSAREKVARAFTEGMAIHITGGHYRAKHCLYHCEACGHSYHIENEAERRTCPTCGSNQVYCNKRHGGHGRRHHQGDGRGGNHCERWCQSPSSQTESPTEEG